ncbi:MAG: hypothetical protein ACOWWR_17205 [Eubacteriales bacterium]
MSTIVAVRKNDIAVIGADTLMKYGSLKQGADLIQNSTKILKVKDNYISTVGDCAFHYALQSYFFKMNQNPSLQSSFEIFEFACDFHKALKEDYYLRPEEEDDDDFESSRFESLIVNSKGIFGLYSLRSVDEYSKYFSFGTGARFALGAMQAVYDSQITAEEIAIKGLEAAAYFDDATGKPFHTFSVSLMEQL